jgi:hypothetical protein
LSDIVDNNGAVCISVVHGRQGLVSLLTRRIPDLELHCGVLIERDGLCKESGADCGFPIRVELVLVCGQLLCCTIHGRELERTLTNRNTIELFPTADSPVQGQHAYPLSDPEQLTQQHQFELSKAVVHAARARGTASSHGKYVMWKSWRL